MISLEEALAEDCSSSEATSTSGSESDDDDDDSSYSDSTDSESLGDIIESMGGVAALAALKPAVGGQRRKSGSSITSGTDQQELTASQRLGQSQRRKSLPNLMELEADVAPSTIANDQQREALERFMDRMNNAADSYFQDPRGDPGSRMPPKSKSTGNMQDICKNAVDLANPSNYFRNMLESELPPGTTDIGQLFSDDFWDSYFLPITEKRRQAYTSPVVQAIRDQDLPGLQTILAREGDASMEACNAQGETLLHLACRRRNHELVKFLVITAHIGIQVRDDFGKTPLHEVCWYTEPRNRSQFDSIEFLMVLAPHMFFARDKRGYTPLQYAPKNSWNDWCRFLARNRESIRSKVRPMEFK